MNPNESLPPSAAQIIKDLAGAQLIDVAGVPALITPKGTEIKLFDNLVAPKALSTKAKIDAHDVDGFVDYINQFKGEGTRIFAALEPKPALKAVIDYHSPAQAALCSHIVNCAMQHSEEWKRWTGTDGAKNAMTQKAFGLFIEDNAKDVIVPSGGDLLQMALQFSSLRAVTFQSGQRLQDGTVAFEYKEEEKSGTARLPPQIELGLPVFRGDKEAYKIKARLKYVIKDGQLAIWFELERPDLVMDEAYQQVITDVAARTSISIFRGMPQGL